MKQKDLREEILKIVQDMVISGSGAKGYKELISLFQKEIEELPTGLFDSTPYKENLLKRLTWKKV